MKIIIVYATLSGNTEELAHSIAGRLKQNGADVEIEEASFVTPEELLSRDYVIIGSYTWGDGDVPDEMLDIYEELEKTDLQGKTFAVFGYGDTAYMEFAGAVDHLEEVIRNQKAFLAAKSFKADVDGDASEIKKQTDVFCSEFLENTGSKIV